MFEVFRPKPKKEITVSQEEFLKEGSKNVAETMQTPVGRSERMAAIVSEEASEAFRKTHAGTLPEVFRVEKLEDVMYRATKEAGALYTPELFEDQKKAEKTLAEEGARLESLAHQVASASAAVQKAQESGSGFDAALRTLQQARSEYAEATASYDEATAQYGQVFNRYV